MNLLKSFLQDEAGATAIEYGLIAALVSVAILGILSTLGQELESTFTNVQSSLAAGNSAASP